MEPQTLPTDFGWRWPTYTWLLIKKRFGLIWGITLIYLLVLLTASMIPVLGALANGFLTPILTVGFLKIFNHLDESLPTQTGDLFVVFTESRKFEKYLPLCLTSAGLGGAAHFVFWIMRKTFESAHGDLLSVAWLFVVGGIAIVVLASAMLVILCYAPALIYFQEIQAVQAMRRSIELTILNWFPLTIAGLVYLGMILGCFLTLLLGFALVVPMIQAFAYILYRETFRIASR